MDFKTEITKFHYNRPNNIPTVFGIILYVASAFYNIITMVRNFLYDRNILAIDCVNAKVISVGNLTTGGVGKTPVVAGLANYFASQYGERVCIISRGYGGHLDNKIVNIIKKDGKINFDAYYAGDEPFWLAQNTHPEVCVLTSANRVKAAEFASDKLLATKIILDDGFQHRKLYRN